GYCLTSFKMRIYNRIKLGTSKESTRVSIWLARYVVRDRTAGTLWSLSGRPVQCWSAGARNLSYRLPSFAYSCKIGSKRTIEKGSTLLEVMVASLVLGIAVVGVALMMSSARSFVVAHGDERVGFYLAQDKLENLRALGFAAIPLTPGGACAANPPYGTTWYNEPNLTTAEDNSQTFTRVTEVRCVAKSDLNTPIDCPTPQVLKRLTVTVTPSMRQANPMVLQTVLACQQC